MDRSVVVLLLVSAALAADRPTVSRALEERTGHGLNPAPAPARPVTPTLPPGISLAAPLSEDDAVAVALWNNAALQAELSQLGVARADLLEAGLLRNPNLSLLLPVGAKPFELLLGLPVEALWQRPRRVAAMRIDVDAVAEGLVQHGLNLARDARVAQIELAAAERRLIIAKEGAELLAKIADLTEKRRRAGDTTGLDVRLARTEGQAAADQAARLSGGVDIARQRLRAVLGLRNDATSVNAALNSRPAQTPPPWSELVEAALSARPDLRAAELAIEAAVKRAGWERARILALIPTLSSKEVGDRGVLSGPGVGFDIPLFDRKQGAVSRAEAEVERATRRYLALRDQVEAEVRQARVALVEASERYERIGGHLVPAARETIRLAEKAHAAGDISHLTVLEASRRLVEFRTQESDAAVDVRRAAAELERSVGKKL